MSAIADRALRTLLRDAGNEQAAESEVIWREVHRRIQGIARSTLSRLPHGVDANDVVQDVMGRLFRDAIREKAANAASPSAYIAKMLRNAAFDAIRRTHREEAARLSAPVSASSTADQGVESDSVEGLEEALTMLTPAELRLLRSRFWEGKTLRLIANDLDIPFSTAAMRVFRLIAKLRSLMNLPR